MARGWLAYLVALAGMVGTPPLINEFTIYWAISVVGKATLYY